MSAEETKREDVSRVIKAVEKWLIAVILVDHFHELPAAREELISAIIEGPK